MGALTVTGRASWTEVAARGRGPAAVWPVGSDQGSSLAAELVLGQRGGEHSVGRLWRRCCGGPGCLGLLVQLGLQTQPSRVPPFPVKPDGAGLWGAGLASSWGRCEAGSCPSAQNIPPFLRNVRSNFLSFQGNLGFSYKPIFLTIFFLVV